MGAEIQTDVLKAVSRSFYLSLRLLPSRMRKPASVAYLLARISDTIADSAVLPVDARIAHLEAFEGQVRSGKSTDSELPQISQKLTDHGERVLMERSREVLDEFHSCSPEEILLIREVMEEIIKGQKLDLTRFREADSGNVVCLPDEAALDEYTWLVAGCVGRFWTKLGFLTLGAGYSETAESEMIDLGIEYGKGLQLVNILRDLPSDLEAGRSYLPVDNPSDREELMAEFAKWRGLASDKVASSFRYSDCLNSKRLKIATVLPAEIAERTLELLEGVSYSDLEKRIKVPRCEVYSILFRKLVGF